MMTLLDERSVPSLRHEIGRLLAAADRADIAVRHVRLAALDLTADEVRGIRRCRLLLGRLEAATLGDIRSGGPPRAEHMRALLDFLDSGRIEIRSASLGAWTPDFSIFHPAAGPVICLLGAHYFHQAPASLGPSFTTALTDPEAVRAATGRFEDLWAVSHDVMEPVRHAVLHSLRAP